MAKKQSLAGITRQIVKYKKLRFEEKRLWGKEARAKEQYESAKRLRKAKEMEAHGILEAVRLLYELDSKTEHRLLDSPTSSLVSCKMASNSLFISEIENLGLSKSANERLQIWLKVFFVGDLVQKTGMELAKEFGGGIASHGFGEVVKIKSILDSKGLHLGIEITDWVQPPKPTNETAEPAEQKTHSCWL